MDAIYFSRELLDLIYVVSIPILLYLILKTDRNSRKRLDAIISEIAKSNQILNELKDK